MRGVTKKQLHALRREAKLAGDDSQVMVCGAALNGHQAAIDECARVIDEAHAAADQSMETYLISSIQSGLALGVAEGASPAQALRNLRKEMCIGLRRDQISIEILEDQEPPQPDERAGYCAEPECMAQATHGDHCADH